MAKSIKADINAFMAARIAERTTHNLKIVILLDGDACTLYPKDQATKQRWLDGYARKGIPVVES